MATQTVSRIKIRCSSCQELLSIPESYAGRRVKCPSCQQPLRVLLVMPTRAVMSDCNNDGGRPDLPQYKNSRKSYLVICTLVGALLGGLAAYLFGPRPAPFVWNGQSPYLERVDDSLFSADSTKVAINRQIGTNILFGALLGTAAAFAIATASSSHKSGFPQ